MFFIPSISALLMLMFGIGVLVLNPRRAANQFLFLIGVTGVVHFAAMLMGRYEGAMWWHDPAQFNPLPWLRVKWASIGLAPLSCAGLYYTVSGLYRDQRDLMRKLLPWMFISAALCAMPYSELFIPHTSLPNNKSTGPLYHVYEYLMVGSVLGICVRAAFVYRRLRGIRRLEFGLLALGMMYLTLAAVLVPQIFYFSGFWIFALLAWHISSHRIYHTSEILLSLVERVTVVTAAAIATALVLKLASKLNGSFWPNIVVVALAFLGWSTLDMWLRDRLKWRREQQLERLRHELEQAAQIQSDPDDLIATISHTLQSFSKSQKVAVLSLRDNVYTAIRQPSIASTIIALLRDGMYSTTSQVRVGRAAQYEDLALVMEENGFQVLVAPRMTGELPPLIILFGERETQLPYSYPEVRLLKEAADVVTSLYTRARFLLQARQSEQLATIGRLGVNIAHELRNPMFTLKSFSQMLPAKLDNHQFLKEFSEVIPAEADRIAALAEQLLDLSKPRKYSMAPSDVHRVIEETVLLMRPRSESYGIAINCELNARRSMVMSDVNTLRQVFINLIQNAMDVLRERVGPKWVKIITSVQRDEGIVIVVEDNGPGLPAALKGKLFQAFASADKHGGLGIGLALSQEIINVHRGNIRADVTRSEGCAFTMTLPLIRDSSDTL